jgi:hypothetical protein
MLLHYNTIYEVTQSRTHASHKISFSDNTLPRNRSPGRNVALAVAPMEIIDDFDYWIWSAS